MDNNETDKNKKLEAADVINILAGMLKDYNDAAGLTTGSCIHQSPTGAVYCANGLTKAQCDGLNGTWYQGQTCS